MSEIGKPRTMDPWSTLRRQFAPRRVVSQWVPLGADAQSQNVRRVLMDGIGVGIAAAAAPYLPVFLTRLGADNFAVGLLTSMPALAGLVLAVSVGQFLARRRNIVPWYSGARFIVISCYALTGLVPFFVTDRQVLFILLIWAVATIPQTFVDVSFTIVMSRVAGPEGRFYLMSRRWSSLGMTTAIVVAFAGFILNRLPFPINFQIVFVALALGGLLSLRSSSRIQLPPQAPPARSLAGAARARDWLAQIRANPRFVRTIGSQFVFRFGLAFAIPLFPLYYVRVLNASNEAIGLINPVSGAVLMVAYFMWARVTKKRGIRFALLVTTSCIAIYPLILAFTEAIPLVILLSGLAGIFAAGIDLVLFDMVVSSYPQEQAPTFVGVQQTTVYSATFVAPLVATVLASAVSIPFALVVGSLIRLAGVGAFLVFARDT